MTGHDSLEPPGVCAHTCDRGWLVLTGEAYWSREAKLPFMPEQILVRPSWFDFGTANGPREFAANRCPVCELYTTGLQQECSHRFKSGFVFVGAGLFWWSGKEPYRPDFFFRYFRFAREGKRLEVICRPRAFALPSMISGAPARRCRVCAGLELPLHAAQA